MDHIEYAEFMFNEGSYGRAGMVTGLALEAYLKHLCVINKIKCDDKSTISKLAQTLLTEGAIDNVEFARLAYLTSIRNKCAHRRMHQKMKLNPLSATSKR